MPKISFYFAKLQKIDFNLCNDHYSFNPRKCNSSSTLSSCIEREMLRVIIALPTSNEAVDIFEKTITGGFSWVNIRLAFDAEILLPNLINEAIKVI